MSYILKLCDAVEDDLAELYETNARQAALWDQLFDTLIDNEALRQQLCRHNGYNAVQPAFDTLPVGAYLNRGFNVVRLKLYGRGRTLSHRLLFTLHHKAIDHGTIWLLGLMQREADYDPQDAFGTRIRQQYDSLGIPRVSRG